MSNIIAFNSIAEIHEALGLEPPKHPLVTVVNLKDLAEKVKEYNDKYTMNVFMVSLKDGITGSLGYGRNSYDFSNGMMVFCKPNQVLSSEDEEIEPDSEGWMLLFHPDLIRKSELGKNIESYSYFDYEVHEALHLSEAEKLTLTELVRKVEQEYNQNIDKHSQKLIVANIELILDYCNRYYDRQFYVRTNLNQDLVIKFDNLLKAYYAADKPYELGLPTVKYCGEELNMSANYLSDLLKKETGKNAKDHIYAYVINKAKNKLLATTDSISEIAYNLGFEYPQHFSKLFKQKTGQSPVAYRKMN